MDINNGVLVNYGVTNVAQHMSITIPCSYNNTYIVLSTPTNETINVMGGGAPTTYNKTNTSFNLTYWQATGWQTGEYFSYITVGY